MENSDQTTREVSDGYIKTTRTVITYKAVEDRIDELLDAKAVLTSSWDATVDQQASIQEALDADAAELTELGYTPDEQ